MKTLVLYVFHQFNEYVHFFLKKGVFESDNITFLFIINNPNYDPFIIPSFSNIQILKRENKYADFGAWSDGLIYNNNINNHTHFIFINSSCVGPFIHPNITEKWTTIFLRGLERDNIKLFGTTINTINDCSGNSSHVQTWAFCMKQNEVKLCLHHKIFDPINYTKMDTKDELIYNHEIPMSQLIIKNGGNIGAMTKLYYGVNFCDNKSNKYGWLGDIAYSKAYIGETTNPYEVMFVKANRNICKNWLQLYIY
jgi:hypothetical protein